MKVAVAEKHRILPHNELSIYLVFNKKRKMSMKKTWSIILKVIIAVAGAIAGVVGVQAANL